MKSYFVLDVSKKLLITLTLLAAAFRCSDEHMLIEPDMLSTTQDLNTTTVTTTETLDCSSCDYVIPEGQTIIDAAVLGLKPGSIIGLKANVLYGSMTFRNLNGTADNPIIIKNCGGQAIIDGTGKGHSIKTDNSRYFRITGGDVDGYYGIVINSGHMSLNIGGLSTDFEIDHLEIKNSGFAGIMAKTDPSCNEETWRENFLMKDVKIHHNYIHETGGEGIYAGNSWYGGMNTDCGVKYPHDIHNISINNNTLENTGWEAIQLGCATTGAEIHHNTVENYGTKNEKPHNNGIQIGAGTGGLCYNNLIKKGSGNGLIVNGLGDNIIYNNVIDQAGNFGVFCDERTSSGPGYKFISNTILNPGNDGIRIYAEELPMNVIVNNIISNPGSYSTYVYPRSPEDAFVYRLSKEVNIEMSNNFFTTETESIKIVKTSQSDYGIDNTSPVVDKGRDVSVYHNIRTDYLDNARLNGDGCDIGAVESFSGANAPAPNVLPVVNAGSDQSVTLPVNSVVLQGSASDKDGTITGLEWSQLSGALATLEGRSTSRLVVTSLQKGSYVFRLTATDNSGESQYDDVQVKVLSEDNIAPLANAGPNQVIAFPATSVKLFGSGEDADGQVVAYKWSQYGGAPATIHQPESASTTVSGLSEGKYYFRLTVEDDEGATHEDNVLIRVDANEIPVADAGANQVLTLPENAAILAGSGTDADGSIVAWRWSQYGGPLVNIAGANSATASVGGLTAGKYYFTLTVTDNDGATHSDNVLVRVDAPTDASAGEPDENDLANAAPEANAGPNQVVVLPASSTKLYGSASDSDGTIESYKWTQYGGAEVDLTSVHQPTATVSGLDAGKYYFRLTVTDNDGTSSSDQMLVRVLPADSDI